MESLFGLISHHLDVVFFVYGLSFVALGLAITFQPKRGSVLKLADHLWLLAGFGLAHGSNEWAEMWIMIKGGNETLVAAQQLNLFISFLFLFEFGRRLMSVSAGAVPSKLSRFLAWQLTPLAALAAAAFSLTSHAFEASIWIRYILCLPGAVMTGTGFLLFCSRERETIKALRSERYFRYAGTFFLLYGFFSGMVGPKGDFFPANVLNFDSFFRVTHLPVQVFRACAAVVITWAVLRMLGIFDRELKERIQKTLSFEKESRELIERLSRRNELILNAAGEGICGVDASGRITFANPSAAFMFRCRVEELTGMALAAVAQKSASGGVSRLTQDHPIVKTITSGVAQHVTGEVFMRKDGTSFTADYISTPIMEHNEFVGAVVVFRDITRDIEAEEERGKLEVQLRQSQKMEAIGRLVTGIAHEINNPLTNASLSLEFLRRKLMMNRLENDFFIRLDAIERNIARASSIARELLEFSRPRQHELAPLDVIGVMKSALMFVEYKLGRISVHHDFQPVPPVMGDPVRLEQVFVNVLNNSIEAMPHGGRLSLSSSLSSGQVEVRVSDTGAGISEENLAKVFDPFFTTKEVGAGTGLGLSICYEIISQYSGTMDISSTAGKGTTVIMRLPVKEH